MRQVYEAQSEQDTAWVFHLNNPHVAVELRRLAHQLKAAGHRKYSIKGLFEVLPIEKFWPRRGVVEVRFGAPLDVTELRPEDMVDRVRAASAGIIESGSVPA